jgi:hypothetical protein
MRAVLKADAKLLTTLADGHPFVPLELLVGGPFVLPEPLWNRQRLTTLGMLVVTLSGLGCYPTATWLPDSSGFVYTEGNKRLVLHDLTKGRRVLIADINCDRVAVSPDGLLIAVAVLEEGGWHVVLYDREGNEQKRSHGKLEAKKEDFGLPARLYWARRGDKVLIEVPTSSAAVYDVKNNSLKKIPDYPGNSLKEIAGNPSIALAVDGTPMCPDSKGFIAITFDEKVEKFKFVVVDWNGKQRAIEANEELRKVLRMQFKDEERWENAVARMVALPYLRSSQWEGAVASISDSGISLRFDTKKLEATGRVLQCPLTTEKEPIRHQHEFPDGANQTC